MGKVDTTVASGWFVGGVALFLMLTALAIWGPGSKVNPPETPQKSFTEAHYGILNPRPRGREFDTHNPNPQFELRRAWSVGEKCLLDQCPAGLE